MKNNGFNKFSKSYPNINFGGRVSFLKLITNLFLSNLLAGLLISTVFGGFLWPYAINTWLIYFSKSAKVTFLHGMLLGVIPGIGFAQFPIAAFTWIVMLFLIP